MSDTYARAGNDNRGRAVFGALLLVLGIVFLLDQVFPLDLGRQGWPLFVIAPGVVLCAFGVALRGAGGQAMFTVGTITTVVGLVLAYQNFTNHWESWAYAWALVGPGAVGLSQMLYGMFMGRGDLVRTGTRVAGVGLIVFIFLGAFFELAVGISGRQMAWLSGYIFPALLIGLGVLMLVGNIWPGRKDTRPARPVPAPQREQGPLADAREVDEQNSGQA